MTRRSVEIELKANARAAKREFDQVAKSLRDVDDELADVETAGKRAARAIERSADDMIDEIDVTRRAVERMADALGDLEADPREVVADLKRLGLTAEEIEADADDLAAALRRIDDVKLSARNAGFVDLDQAMGTTSDNARVTSTAIGGIGNSISELPGVGSLGPVAESMGMLAENALEGEANMKGLVTAGAGLAAVGGLMFILNQHMEEQAEIDAFNKKRVEDWTDAIVDAENALEGMTDAYRNAGIIEVDTLFDGVKDITPTLARAGISVDDWTAAIAGGESAAEELGLRMKQAGVTGDSLEHVMVGLIRAQDNYRDATAAAAARTSVFGQDIAMTDRQLERLRDRVDRYRASLDGIDSVKATRIEALMDEGKYTEAMRLLDELTAPRSVRLSVHGNAMTAVRATDTGGVYGAGQVGMVAERRPERVNGRLITRPTVIRGPAKVTSGAETAAELARPTGTGGDTYVTVIAPAGVDLPTLQRRHYRRTGRPT